MESVEGVEGVEGGRVFGLQASSNNTIDSNQCETNKNQECEKAQIQRVKAFFFLTIALTANVSLKYKRNIS